MPAQISSELLKLLTASEAADSLLTLLTLTDPVFPGGEMRLVNNTEDIISRGKVYTAMPFRITLPNDDGESNREVNIVLDNTSLEIIEYLRSTIEEIPAKVEVVLGSLPDEVQIDMTELVIRSIQYDVNNIQAKLSMDDFLNTEVTSENYNPSNFPGLF